MVQREKKKIKSPKKTQKKIFFSGEITGFCGNDSQFFALPNKHKNSQKIQ